QGHLERARLDLVVDGPERERVLLLGCGQGRPGRSQGWPRARRRGCHLAEGGQRDDPEKAQHDHREQRELDRRHSAPRPWSRRRGRERASHRRCTRGLELVAHGFSLPSVYSPSGRQSRSNAPPSASGPLNRTPTLRSGETRARASSSRATSPWSATASAPRRPASAPTRSAPSRLRWSFTTRRVPSRAYARATARPKPRPAAVTGATLPASR